MPHEMTIDEMQRLLGPLRGYVRRKIQHRKTQGWYRVVSVQFREDDMTIWFTYETCHREPVQFMRPIGELLDGRFEIGVQND